MSGDPRFDLLGQPCLTCWGRGGVHLGGCPNDDAPRPESGGQQQAAAELTGCRPWGYGAYCTHRRDDTGQVPWDQCRWVPVAAALAEAARPGQELRARVTDIAEDLEIHSEEVGRGEGDLNELDLERYAARLRAALEDPR